MTTGYNFKQLALVNFGDQNITRSKIFDQSPKSSSDPIIFEAIRSLLDQNYLNEKVTKPRDARSVSSVELTYEWRRREYKLKRVFGTDGGIFLNGKVATQIPEGLLSLHKPQYDTPSSITDQMMSEFFRRRFDGENSLRALVQQLLMSAEYNPMAITWASRGAQIQFEIEEDLITHEKIEKLEWDLSLTNPTTNDAYYREVENIIPATPMDEFSFRNSLVNIFLASSQFNITDNQRDLYDRLVKEINCEHDAFCFEFDMPYGWERTLRAIKMSKKLEQHDAEQLDFYKTNINIVSKYKENFPTPEEWETEKENIKGNLSEENQFRNELSRNVLTDAAKEVSEKLVDSDRTIKNLGQDVILSDTTTLKTIIFEAQMFYIYENVILLLNEFSEALCESLNNPMLEIANISKAIVGSVHSIANNAEAPLKPEFLFDHVSSLHGRRSEHLFNHVQTYLAPFSNYQFAKTKDQLNHLLEAIERQPRDESCRTTFTFTAYENIAPGGAPRDIGPRRLRMLTNIQREFGYNDTMTNLLSNCGITCDKKLTLQNSNLLNLATKRIARTDKEKSFVTESEYLFKLLRQIKGSYVDIGHYLLDAKRFDEKFIRDAHDLQRRLDEYYNNESLCRSELMNRMRLFFEQQSIANQEQAIKSLTARCTNRITIRDQLLSLQHTNGCDDSKFVQTLSQRDLDTLEVKLCDMNDMDVSITFSDETLQDYINYLRDQPEHITSVLINIYEMWKKLSDQLSVEPNDAQSKRLSTMSSINFLLCSHYFKDFELRRKIPRGYRRENNLSIQEIFDQIDELVSQLYYPKGSPARLERCKQILATSDQNQTNTLDMINKIGKLLLHRDYTISKTLDDICNRVTAAVAYVMKNANYTAHFELINASYESITCTALKRLINLYGKNGDNLVPDVDDTVSIFIYVYFVRQFTESPIILDEIMETCDETTLKNVLTFMKRSVTDRFALVRNPNENQTDLYLNGHSTEAMNVDEAGVDAGVGQGVDEAVLDPVAGHGQDENLQDLEEAVVEPVVSQGRGEAMDNDPRSDGDQNPQDVDEAVLDPVAGHGQDENSQDLGEAVVEPVVDQGRVEAMDIDNDPRSDGDLNPQDVDGAVVDPVAGHGQGRAFDLFENLLSYGDQNSQDVYEAVDESDVGEGQSEVMDTDNDL